MNANYGTVIDGKITAPLTMRSQFAGVLAFHTLSDKERAEQANWYPADIINESYNARSQIRSTEPEKTFDGERITVTYTVTDKPLETIQVESLDELALIRYAAETGGVTSPEGINQPTTRAERLLLADKLAFMRENPSVESTMWKASGVWNDLTTAQLGELQTLVGTHVNKCYLAEHAVALQVSAASTVSEVVAINLTSAFDDAFAAI